ncbi:MAG TPA: histidinol-phosphate transaminase [Syntrophorhabdaceae bacterium]|nr:histidinol-phosphate transaminase [Syntrophorhabdaceae bacterium]
MMDIEKEITEIPHYPKAMMYGDAEGWVRLASNENPYPPSKSVLEAILDNLFGIGRYPGGEYELKESIALKFNIKANQVVLGDGSDEIIEMILKALRHKEKNEVIVTEPCFPFYAIASKIYGYSLKKVPLKDMKTDLNRIKDAIDSKTRIIFLNNPLNPTGTIFKEAEFEDFIKEIPQNILVAVDEAYGEFAEDRDFPQSIRYTEKYPVLVLKTFSKAYALAGLRIGYCIGDASLISYLERTRQPFSINSMALVAARAALSDEGFLKKVLKNNRAGKAFFYEFFDSLSLEYVPSEANFILVRLGHDAESITKKLFEEKILVRWMGAYGLPEYIRVTIGNQEENKRFIEALRRLLR